MAAQQGPNKRTMVILCVILGLLAIVAVFRFVKPGGGGDDGGTTAPPATSVTAPATSPSTTTTTTPPGEPTVPTGEFDVFATRDPFEPVVQVGSSPTSTGEGTSGSSVTPAPVVPDTSGQTTVTTTAAQNPAGGTSVVLVDVFAAADGSTQARIQVGSTVYTVSAGQTFATSYKVVSLNGTCGQFLYGDSPFPLCEGEQTIK